MSQHESEPFWKIIQRLAGQPDKIDFPFQHPAVGPIYGIIERLDEPSDEEFYDLPRRDRYAWLVFRFEKQVMNGGVDQYLCNSSGSLALECIEALKDIGAANSHALLRRACELVFENHPSHDQDQRQAQMRDFRLKHGDLLDACLAREMDVVIEPDLYAKLLAYYERTDAATM